MHHMLNGYNSNMITKGAERCICSKVTAQKHRSKHGSLLPRCRRKNATVMLLPLEIGQMQPLQPRPIGLLVNQVTWRKLVYVVLGGQENDLLEQARPSDERHVVAVREVGSVD
eukprot:198898-Pleurochrysis_carterae.AAC.1